jgi:hypothetical protein
MSVFGPPDAAQILRETISPFVDLGVMGALPSRSRGLGGSDNTSFSQAGLPGIGVNQDPIEYNSATWHTNLDNYERIIEDDAKKVGDSHRGRGLPTRNARRATSAFHRD